MSKPEFFAGSGISTEEACLLTVRHPA